MQKLILPLTNEEVLKLEEMACNHRFGDYRFKARGIIAINAEVKAHMIAEVLGMCEKSIYNWAKLWRTDRFEGLFNSHKGGPKVKLTTEMVATALEVATSEALTLAAIKQRVLERHPQSPDFSLDRLAVRLKEHGMSFKRCRLSLKKSVPNPNL